MERVEYFEIPEVGIKPTIEQGFLNFKKWCAETFQDDENEIEFLENLNSLDRLSDAPTLLQDEIISHYIGFYCDFGPGQKNVSIVKEAFGVKNYNQETHRVEKNGSKEIYWLWSCLINGRSTDGTSNLKISDSVFKFCFFNEDECQLIKNELGSIYGKVSPEKLNENHPAIELTLRALRNKKNEGILITVA